MFSGNTILMQDNTTRNFARSTSYIKAITINLNGFRGSGILSLVFANIALQVRKNNSIIGTFTSGTTGDCSITFTSTDKIEVWYMSNLTTAKITSVIFKGGLFSVS